MTNHTNASSRRKKNRVGRPPDADSVETRRRILAAARVCFGRFGYDKTTNRHIADAAGITTGAIYHYFPSKQALFAATYREVQEIVFSSFTEASEKEEGLVDKVLAFLDAAVELHAADQSLASFASMSPLELQRHPELQLELGDGAAGAYPFFEKLIEDGANWLPADVDPAAVVNFLVASVLGLAQFAAVSNSVGTHREATDAFKRVIEGTLFVNPARDGRRRLRRR